MNSDLLEMKNLWVELEIEPYFHKVHHFSSDKFASHSAKLSAFFNHCKDRNIQGENRQTLARAKLAAILNKSGQHIDSAIAQSWEHFSLVKR